MLDRADTGVAAIQRALTDWLYDETDGVVISGPFAGMKLPREQSWPDGALGPMILGCHEQELHSSIEQEIERLSQNPSARIVNVGCAEGYYAVGLARRLPSATVVAMDISEEALDITAKAAADNGVSVEFEGDPNKAFAGQDLIVMDCEGQEIGYLDKGRFPGLSRGTIIVEIHSSAAATAIHERFSDTHEILVAVESGRNPNFFEILRGRPSHERWLAVSENRPCMMFWYVMRPKWVTP